MLIQGDCARIPLPDESVDLIFTDPPYAKASLYLYEILAKESMRLLKPSGFVLAMCGGNYNGPIHKMFLDAGLTCFFDIAVPMSSGRASAYLWHIGVLVRSKFIISYSKGAGAISTNGMHNSYIGRKDKCYHSWGQDVDTFRYFIEHFSCPGDLVLDPMVGGGTTIVAAELAKRRYIGMDIDFTSCQISQQRIAESDILHNLPLFTKMES